MADGYVDAAAAQSLDDRRCVHVAAGDAMASLGKDEGQATHAATADSDKMIGEAGCSVLTHSASGGEFAGPEILQVGR